MAEVERDRGQLDDARYCLRQALKAGPANPAILFRAANLAFTMGDRAETLRTLSLILANPESSAYFQPAFLTYSRLGSPIEELLDKGIPRSAGTAEQFLKFWMDGGQLPAAKATWDWMVKNSLTSDKSCGSFVSYLLRNGAVETAVQEWRRVNLNSSANFQVVNWIFNGGFEMEPKPGPFDWHIESTSDVEATRVEDVSRDGQWSVRMVFAGQSGTEYHGVYQQAVITPGQWRLRAFLKTDGLAAGEGIALRVYDPDKPSRLDVRSNPITGTNGWVDVERSFVAQADTALIRVEAVRSPARKPDAKLVSRAWLDSLELNPIR